MVKHGILLIVISLSLFGCKDKDDKSDKPSPAFESSIPTDGSVDVKTDIEISITFDESISLASKHGITVNELPATVMRSNIKLTTIIVTTDLEFQTKYTVKIPVGAVINTQGVGLNIPVEFSFTTKPAPKNLGETELVVANPSSQAVNVYNFLKENYGIKSISSTMANVNWNLNEAEWVYKHTGKYPAMATFDYIHLPFSPVNWIDYSKTDFIEEWWSYNGLISASWHWNVPKKEGSTEYTYKPEETTFKASNALLEGTWENDFIVADLKKIANYLKLLQQKEIPVIWRPLHEAAGNIYEYDGGKAWFWWGAGGAETFKNLWIYMFNYFEAEGLNNLIWVWTTQTKDEAFYPGDEYVDIIGRDIYNKTGANDVADQFNQIQDAYPGKIITLSEFGNVASFQSQWSAGAKWSYFMPWYDYDRTINPNSLEFDSPDHQHASAQWWIDAFANEAVISLDEMPDLK